MVLATTNNVPELLQDMLLGDGGIDPTQDHFIDWSNGAGRDETASVEGTGVGCLLEDTLQHLRLTAKVETAGTGAERPSVLEADGRTQ